MIVRVIPELKIGGVERGVIEEIENIEEYKLICIQKANFDLVDNKYHNKITELNSKWFNFVFLFFYALKFSRTNNDFVIVSSLWKSHFFSLSLLLLSKSKMIVFSHSSQYAHFLDAIFSRAAIFFSKCVFADSKSTANFIGLNFPNKTKHVIPFNFTKDSKCILSKGDVSLHDVNIIYLGRINKVKRLGKAILFVKHLKEFGLNVKFDIYGPVEDSSFLETIREIDYINYNGVVSFSDVDDVLINYDFFIQCSSREGMAESVFRSMSLGVIPIVTPVGEIPSYSEDGVSAIYFNSNLSDDSIYKQSSFLYDLLRDKEKLAIMSEKAKSSIKKYPLYLDTFNYSIKENE